MISRKLIVYVAVTYLTVLAVLIWWHFPTSTSRLDETQTENLITDLDTASDVISKTKTHEEFLESRTSLERLIDNISSQIEQLAPNKSNVDFSIQKQGNQLLLSLQQFRDAARKLEGVVGENQASALCEKVDSLLVKRINSNVFKFLQRNSIFLALIGTLASSVLALEWVKYANATKARWKEQEEERGRSQ